MKPLRSRKQADALLKQHDLGGRSWKIRTEQVVCAANSGDSGLRETYNNGEQDILMIEYPNARYTSKCYALV